MEKGFVFLDEVLPGVRWDAKYATWDNFTGKPVTGYTANRVAGSLEMALALRDAAAAARSRGLGLLLWDGYRPQRAVDCFLAWSRQPEDNLTRAKYYPRINRAEMVIKGYVAEKSGHSRGGAIDLTLYRTDTDARLDMGGGFDLMDAQSHHGAAGITPEAAQNRRLLRALMESSGFVAYPCEWWHYTLANEPYPDTYFDFLLYSQPT